MTPAELLASMGDAPAFRRQLSFDSFDFGDCPPERLDDLMRYLLEWDGAFAEIGDAKLYLAHAQRLTDHLHAQVLTNPADRFWLHVASIYARRMKLVPLYFTDANLRSIASKRGDILEWVLRAAGHAIDHPFAARDPSRRIRLGVLCAGIGEITGTSTALPLFEYLDRTRFEVILYLAQPTGSSGEAYFAQRVDGVVRASEDLRSLVSTIRQDDLDIILFAANVAAGSNIWSKVAAHRLARVQLSDFTTPITTGLRHVDGFISGKLSEPADAQGHYREALISLEGPGYCLDTAPASQTKPTKNYDRAAMGIDPNAIVYASGANYFKLIPELLDTWANIVARVRNSVLVLYPLGPSWSQRYPVASLIEGLHRHFDPGRIVLLPTLPGRADIKAMLAVADVYLDSFPHSGSFSLFDPLEIGLPSATLLGQTLRGRHGAALLIDMGIDELVTSNVEEYTALAVKLGTDHAYRAQMRARVAKAIADGPRFCDSRLHAQRLQPVYERLVAQWDDNSR